VPDTYSLTATAKVGSVKNGLDALPSRPHDCRWATIVNIASEGPTVKITFLGKDSTPNDSPTLYKTDRGTLLVQGYVVTDPEALADMRIPEGETVVEVPPSLMKYLPPEGTQHGEGHS
jgi:hypothetical protein